MFGKSLNKDILSQMVVVKNGDVTHGKRISKKITWTTNPSWGEFSPSSVLLLCVFAAFCTTVTLLAVPSGSSAGNCSEATYCKDGTVIAAITLGADFQQPYGTWKTPKSHGVCPRGPTRKIRPGLKKQVLDIRGWWGLMNSPEKDGLISWGGVALGGGPSGLWMFHDTNYRG